MDPLLTPTTDLLYSYLELDAFETPGPSREDSPTDRDVFSHAFGKYNTAYLEPGSAETNTLAEHDKYVAPEHCIRGTAIGQYVTPPGTIEFSNYCIDFAQQPFEILPSPTTVNPTSPKDDELPGTISVPSPSTNISEVRNIDWQTIHHPQGIFELLEPPGDAAVMQGTWMGKRSLAPPEVVHDHAPPIPPPEKVKRRRRSKRKPLSDEAKAMKRANFLQRNRIAADGCRKRKKEKNSSLEERGMVLEFRNMELKEMKDELESEVWCLRRELAARVSDDAEKMDEDVIQEDETEQAASDT